MYRSEGISLGRFPMADSRGAPASVAPSVRRELHPKFEVFDRVLSPRCRLKPAERFVALAIGNRLNRNGECWPSIADIVARTGYSRATVKRALVVLLDGDLPLFSRRWDPAAHKTPVYSLVRSPEAFSTARNKAKAESFARDLVVRKRIGPRSVEQKKVDQARHARKVGLQARREIAGDLTPYEKEELARLEATNQ